ncbi:MAG: aminotransferase class IV family protein [Anaerolineales bacterium]|nr:aminotransferase class IV family protein [Anaerolineales bacterium]
MPIPFVTLKPGLPLEYGQYPADSFRGLAMLEPDGVYTITRTYHRNQCIRLDAHLDRLEESSRLSGVPITLDRAALRAGLRQLLEYASFPETRFRITIPFSDPTTVILAGEVLAAVPESLSHNGVPVATCAGSRDLPRAKRNAWILQRQKIRESLPSGCYEGLIRDDEGQIMEGLSSNFYGIQAGRLLTAEDGILHGITRSIVLELAAQELPVDLHPVPAAMIPSLDEAFLTSSSRAVVPIVKIDEHSLGSGLPGPYTRKLADGYRKWVEENLELIQGD